MAFFRYAGAVRRYILVGRVVTMTAQNQLFPNGAICIQDDSIVAVVPDLAQIPTAFADASVVDTQGTIFPGLIELHNHLSYNFLPLWTVPKRYTNRNQWRTTEPSYDTFVAAPARLLGSNYDVDYPRSIARFVECRSLMGGITTTQGISTSSSAGSQYYQGLIRNVEAPSDPAFPKASGQTLDYAPADIAAKLVPALASNLPFFYHLSEGTDADARQRFLDLQYQPAKWAITAHLMTIHCTALQAADFTRLSQDAGMVWSPLSNFLLYGQTSDIAQAKAQGMTIALGSDWSPSGSKNILGELKIARIVSGNLGGLFTSEELVRMVTSTPAKMLGWDGLVGTIQPGKKADLLIVDGVKGDPFDLLIDTTESDVLAVVIGGRPRYGRMGFLDFDASRQEHVLVGGISYSLDLTEPGSDPLAGLSLATATTKLSYGLQNLPNLVPATPTATLMALNMPREPAISIDMELDPMPPGGLIEAFSLAATPPLQPMTLPPITAVDDPGFIPAIKANPNLPAFLRNAL